MTVTTEQLVSLFPETPRNTIETFIGPLNDTLTKFDINTHLRVSMFVAQVGLESGGFLEIEENLNYSAQRLLQVFPTHFSSLAQSELYEHHPESIANHVYANRMDNGDEQSGDGWKFRGKGLIQITGRADYQEYADGIGVAVDQAAEMASDPEGACLSAGWFWHVHELNQYADASDIVSCTHRINGGYNGLEERQELYRKALAIFSS